jgi:hypothetical protein
MVDTAGLISIDPHLHTQTSDGNMSFLDRIRSLAAEGLDVAVSSDHNYVTDYQRWLEELELEEHLAVIAGNEVTISGMIHYNTFPVAYRESELHHGAIDPISDIVRPLFDLSRETDPDTLVQVNHPRSGTIGYFNQFELENETAASALEGFDTSFDVLEIVNGPSFSEANAESIEDWFHLLNRGYYFPLTGSSDSHGIDGSEPGYSRTYVLYDGGKGETLDRTALIRAMKEGRSFSSNGPIVDFKINGTCIFGDTCTDQDGEVDAKVRIQSAPWIGVDELRLVINGKRDKSLPIVMEDSRALDIVKDISIHLDRDSHIVVEVVGRRSLYPVLQSAAENGDAENAITPYALTNPIFIDVDGNGRFDPPWEESVELVSRDE